MRKPNCNVWKELLSVCFCQVAFTPSIQHLHLQISVTIYKVAYPIQFIYIYIIYIYIHYFDVSIGENLFFPLFLWGY